MAQPPEPPPEARLLRRKRIARKLSPADAARLTGYSPSTYRQVENGYHIPAKGIIVEKIAPPETLARMLHAFGATPRELIDAGRADAAEILEGLIAEESPAAGDPGLAPFIAGVREDLGRAEAEHGPGFTGAQAFSLAHEAETWDDPDRLMPDDGDRVRLIARNRRRAAEWQSEERRIGLRA